MTSGSESSPIFMTTPTLILLHGLLGSADDWAPLQRYLTDIPTLALDLPGHGTQRDIAVADFTEASHWLAEKIRQHLGKAPYILLGYSMGGRLALHYVLQSGIPLGDLRGVIVEGANFGLSNAQEKVLRWQQDLLWAERFCHETPQVVLQDWYQQPVFAHLTEEQRQALIRKRSEQCGANIGSILAALSLAKQMDFRPLLTQMPIPFYYFCGAQDNKFQNISRQAGIEPHLIAAAGHNAHRENPELFAQKLQNCLLKIADSTGK